jgi:hypothetical protein
MQTSDTFRRPSYTNHTAFRQRGTEHNSHDTHAVPASSDASQQSSAGLSPSTGEGSASTPAHTPADAAERVPHSPGAAGAPADPISSQNSPLFPAGAGRNYRPNSGGPGSGSNSPLPGAGGFRDSPHGRGEYRDTREGANRGDSRLNGGRLGGRRNQQQMPPPYSQRGPPPMGMPMHEQMGSPMMRDMNRPFGYSNGAPPPMPPQQWQQQPVSYVDQYGNPISAPPQAGPPQQYPVYPPGAQGVQHQVQRPPQMGGPPQQQVMMQHQPMHQQQQPGPPMFGQMQQQQPPHQQMVPMYQQPYVLQAQPGQQ